MEGCGGKEEGGGRGRPGRGRRRMGGERRDEMGTYEIRISSIRDGHNSDPEELTSSSSEGDVGSLVPEEGREQAREG